MRAAKARNLVTLAESKDDCIRGANIKVDRGRKANTPKAVEDAKSSLRIKDIVGTGNRGLEGLGLKKAIVQYIKQKGTAKHNC